MTREFESADGARWSADLISHGNTSQYLNRRVHRPILQFSPVAGRGPNRYIGYPDGLPVDLDDLTVDQVRDLLARSTVH